MYSISVGGMGETKKVVSDLRSSTPSVSSLLSCCSFIRKKFETLPPASLFETILLQKEQVSLEEFSKAFGKSMEEMVNLLVQRTPHSFYIDPETLVVTVGSHFMEKAIREKFAGSKDSKKFAESKDNALKQPTQ